MVVSICQNIISSESFKCSILERNAVLALSKFMCISNMFCKKYLQLMIDMLQKPKIDSVVKNNVLITLGDLMHRHPNTIEAYGKFLFLSMRDDNRGVRKTALMVITHLVLNDMLKP